MALSDTGLDPGADWAALLARPEASVPADLTLLGRHLASNYVPNCVIVDATASASPPAHYLEWMKVRERERARERGGERGRERESEKEEEQGQCEKEKKLTFSLPLKLFLSINPL